MKKFILSVIFAILISGLITLTVHAVSQKVTINGTEYKLKYSNCDNRSVACMNEYYKANEQGFNWTELFTVVYTKNTNNPFEFAKALANSQKYSDIEINKQENYAIVRFLIPYKDKNGNSVIEQNIAKVMKYSFGNGVVSQQYAVKILLNLSKDTVEKKLQHNESVYSELIKTVPAQRMYTQHLQDW